MYEMNIPFLKNGKYRFIRSKSRPRAKSKPYFRLYIHDKECDYYYHLDIETHAWLRSYKIQYELELRRGEAKWYIFFNSKEDLILFKLTFG
jgi:hypothetical protein